MKSGRAQWQKEETRTFFNIVPIFQEKFFTFEFFKVILDGISLIFHSRTKLIPNNFFEYIYHVGCAINLHSTLNSGLKPGGRNLSTRQTVFKTSVELLNKEHKDPNDIDLEAPRRAWFQQKVEETPKPSVFGRHETFSKEKI